MIQYVHTLTSVCTQRKNCQNNVVNDQASDIVQHPKEPIPLSLTKEVWFVFFFFRHNSQFIAL